MNKQTAELEYSIIGAMCLEPRCVSKIISECSEDDFGIEQCAAVFARAKTETMRGKPFDAVIAAEEIAPAMGDFEAQRFIRECMEVTPTAANAEYHAFLLHKDKAGRDMLSAVQSKLIEAAEPDDTASEIIDVCRDYLDASRSKRTVSLCDAMVQFYKRLDAKETLRIDTGFSKTDAMLKGFCAGNLIVLAARPSVGKTAYAMNLALNAARQGNLVLFYSMEMLSDEIAERMVSTGGVTMDELVDRKEHSEETWTRINGAASRLSTLPIFINDDPSMTVGRMRAEAHATRNLKLIVVDYLSLISSEKRSENRNQEIGAMSRALKNLASELRIPIVLLCQLNRNTDETQMPTLRDLRDSGEIEQNANKVILLWNVDKDEGKVGAFIAKNRRGRTGMALYKFDGAHMLFSELPDEVPARNTRRGRKRYYDDDDE